MCALTSIEIFFQLVEFSEQHQQTTLREMEKILPTQEKFREGIGLYPHAWKPGNQKPSDSVQIRTVTIL